MQLKSLKASLPRLALAAVAATAAMAVTAIAGNAVAADTLNLTVKGKITPPACQASFDVANGTLDWGDIRYTTLNDTTLKTLDAKPITLNVNCPTGTTAEFDFYVVDNKASTAITGPNTGGRTNHGDVNRIFGIGTDAGTTKNIGNFVLNPTTSSHDGTVENVKFGDNHDKNAKPNQSDDMKSWAYSRNESWSVWNTTANTIARANKFTFTFDVEPQINKKSEISATQEVPFEGSAQFNVRYY